MDNNEILFTPIKVSEFLTMISRVVSEELERASSTLKNNNEELLTRSQAKEMLHVSYPTLNEWAKSGKLPSHRIGKKVFYKHKDILDSLKMRNAQ